MTRTAFAPWAALLSARPARLSPLFIAIASLAMTSACMQAQAQANPTSAASTELAAGRIVTTPARVPQGLDAAIPNTTVITREAISQAGNISLVELLRRHSRLEAVALGPYASLQGVAARGGSGGRVLFLLDGVPLSDSGAAAAVALGTTGNNDIARAAIDQIPLSSIERIEVSVGSLSAVYGGEGADAVVNIFSRVERAFRPRERKPASLQLDGQLGSDSLRAGTAHATTSSVDTQIAATVGATRLNPGSVSNANALGYNPDRDPQKQVFGMLKLSQNLMQGEHLSLTLIGVKGEQDVDLRGSLALPGSVQPLSEERVERQLQIAKLTSHTYFSPQWRSRIEVSRQFDKSDYLGRVEQSVRATRDVATWINELGIVGGKLIAGVEVKRDKVSILNNNINALTQPEMTQVGAFIGVRERIGNHRLELNARAETLRGLDEETSNQVTGSEADRKRRPFSLSYAYTMPIAELYIHGGRGYREPTLYERFAPITAVSRTVDGRQIAVAVSGSPTLRVERTLTREIGLRRAGVIGDAMNNAGSNNQSYRVNLSAFDNETTDGIVTVAGLGTTADFSGVVLQPGNAGVTKARGVEFSGDVEWRGYRLSTQLVSQSISTSVSLGSTQTDLPSGRAKQFGNIAISKGLGGLSPALAKVVANASIHWTGARDNPAAVLYQQSQTPAGAAIGTATFDTRLPATTMVNFGLSYALDREWTIDLIANNITNKRYEWIRGYQQPGANVMLNVRYSAQEK